MMIKNKKTVNLILIFVALMWSGFVCVIELSGQMREVLISAATSLLGRSLDRDVWLSRMTGGWFIGVWGIGLFLIIALIYFTNFSSYTGHERNCFFHRYKVLLITFVHWCVSFYTDTAIFVPLKRENLPVYLFWKILFFFLLYFIWKAVFIFVNSESGRIVSTVAYSVPYAVAMWLYFVLKHAEFYVHDEYNIFIAVTEYNLFPCHFTYITGIIHALSLMLIPCYWGTVIVKIIMQAILCGYCISRVNAYTKSEWGVLLYLLFFSKPVMDNSFLVVRMQYYGLLYFLLVFVLIMDELEGKEFGRTKCLMLMILFSTLTFWRKEGFYLLIAAPIVIICAYKIAGVKKRAIVFIAYAMICFIVYIPELFFGSFISEDLPTYNQWFQAMYYEGLDTGKYQNQMSEIYRYIEQDSIDQCMSDLGEECYEDNFFYMYENDDLNQTDIDAYKESVKEIIKHEIPLFIKIHFKLWKHTSIKRGIIDRVFYDLNIPLIALLIVIVISIYKKKWLYFFIAGMVVGHCLITISLAPAAYFKYYYHMYLIGWLFVWGTVIYCLKRKEEKNYL